MTTVPSSAPTKSPYRWPIRLGFGLIVIVVLARIFGWGPFATHEISASAELKKFSIVPPFSLTERSGKLITNADLTGKIWVADFVYTTCPGPRPLVTANMARLQNAVTKDPEVQLVTFTVDPDTDTPAVLAKYADQFAADPNRWWFLTGPKKPLYDLIQNGFLQVVQDNHGQPPEPGQFTVTHSTYMALVDGDGNVRGFYDGVNADGRALLLHDIKVLEKEERL
jgi:protein SCO1